MKHTDNLTSSGRYVRTSADEKDTVEIAEDVNGIMILIKRAGQSFEMFIPARLIPADFVRIPKELAEKLSLAISDVRKNAAKPSNWTKSLDGQTCIDCGKGRLGARIWLVKPSELGKTCSGHECSYCKGHYDIKEHDEAGAIINPF